MITRTRDNEERAVQLRRRKGAAAIAVAVIAGALSGAPGAVAAPGLPGKPGTPATSPDDDRETDGTLPRSGPAPSR
ncbi:hypothetical protein ACFQ0X_28630 [Streptomyces rectiviolaceus]|uniref:hypothetical protein n=1 Tax=Streptomyces rectiviolaceus TaxID=332591 RepID=UPI00362EC645